MLVYFTDAVTKDKIAVNPKYVVVIFVANTGDHQGKTVISMINGSVVVEESQIDVVGILQGQIE